MDTRTAIDIAHIPFSRYGAMVAITHTPKNHTLSLHYVQKRFGQDEFMQLFFTRAPLAYGAMAEGTTERAEALPVAVSADPACVRVRATEGPCEACLTIMDDNRILLEVHRLLAVLRCLPSRGYGTKMPDGRWEVISVPNCTYTMVQPISGAVEIIGPDQRGIESGRLRRLNLHGQIDGTRSKASVLIGIDQVERWADLSACDPARAMKETEEQWHAFLCGMPPSAPAHADFARTTWYNLWSSFVHAQDVYPCDTMLMAKKFMCSIWSWDHCFNALAMARMSPRVALEQFFAPFALQAESGALPDMWNPNTEVVWGVTKPPIHGWCFSKLMDLIPIGEADLRKAYGHLERWTNWWMQYRDADQDGIPDYPQGCDSGWDNGTVFDQSYFVETPDLPAFLILQMRALARIAEKLGQDGAPWQRHADELYARLLSHSVEDGRIIARVSGSHEPVTGEECLLVLMPIVLGKQLDEACRKEIICRLKAKHLTDFGLSTEAYGSPLYEPDGYWRGPIWAPSTYLIVDGLRACGEADLARDIAKRFCEMVAFTAKGNYENFDALTGKGLCAPGYTWTASVYLLLMWEYLKGDEHGVF